MTRSTVAILLLHILLLPPPPLSLAFISGGEPSAASFTLFTAIAIRETRWRRGLTGGEVEATLLFDQSLKRMRVVFFLSVPSLILGIKIVCPQVRRCWFSFYFPRCKKNNNCFFPSRGRADPAERVNLCAKCRYTVLGIFSDSDFYFLNFKNAFKRSPSHSWQV